MSFQQSRDRQRNAILWWNAPAPTVAHTWIWTPLGVFSRSAPASGSTTIFSGINLPNKSILVLSYCWGSGTNNFNITVPGPPGITAVSALAHHTSNIVDTEVATYPNTTGSDINNFNLLATVTGANSTTGAVCFALSLFSKTNGSNPVNPGVSSGNIGTTSPALVGIGVPSGTLFLSPLGRLFPANGSGATNNVGTWTNSSSAPVAIMQGQTVTASTSSQTNALRLDEFFTLDAIGAGSPFTGAWSTVSTGWSSPFFSYT